MRLFLLLGISLLSTALLAQQDKAYTKAINKYRKQYKKEFLKFENSPLNKDDLPYLYFFDPASNYNVVADFELATNEKPFDMATYSGITKPYIKYGTATFQIDSVTYTLAIYQSQRLKMIPLYRNSLFLPFKDITNDDTTYGGGRYLDLSTKDIKDGKINLDFNKAYNPYCAYSDGYNCPIPPAENHLEVAITAGEKNFGKAVKQ